MEKTNYQNCSVTKDDTSKWNDFTVKHEILLASEVLLGNPKHPGLTPIIGHPNIDVVNVWKLRFYRAYQEARIRFADQDYLKEIDDTKLLIDFELV